MSHTVAYIENIETEEGITLQDAIHLYLKDELIELRPHYFAIPGFNKPLNRDINFLHMVDATIDRYKSNCTDSYNINLKNLRVKFAKLFSNGTLFMEGVFESDGFGSASRTIPHEEAARMVKNDCLDYHKSTASYRNEKITNILVYKDKREVLQKLTVQDLPKVLSGYDSRKMYELAMISTGYQLQVLTPKNAPRNIELDNILHHEDHEIGRLCRRIKDAVDNGDLQIINAKIAPVGKIELRQFFKWLLSKESEFAAAGIIIPVMVKDYIQTSVLLPEQQQECSNNNELLNGFSKEEECHIQKLPKDLKGLKKSKIVSLLRLKTKIREKNPEIKFDNKTPGYKNCFIQFIRVYSPQEFEKLSDSYIEKLLRAAGITFPRSQIREDDIWKELFPEYYPIEDK